MQMRPSTRSLVEELSSKIASFDRRLGHLEASVRKIEAKQLELDHRIAVLEKEQTGEVGRLAQESEHLRGVTWELLTNLTELINRQQSELGSRRPLYSPRSVSMSEKLENILVGVHRAARRLDSGRGLSEEDIRKMGEITPEEQAFLLDQLEKIGEAEAAPCDDDTA